MRPFYAYHWSIVLTSLLLVFEQAQATVIANSQLATCVADGSVCLGKVHKLHNSTEKDSR